MLFGASSVVRSSAPCPPVEFFRLVLGCAIVFMQAFGVYQSDERGLVFLDSTET